MHSQCSESCWRSVTSLLKHSLCKKNNFLLKGPGSLKCPFRFCGLNEHFCFSNPENFLIFARFPPLQTADCFKLSFGLGFSKNQINGGVPQLKHFHLVLNSSFFSVAQLSWVCGVWSRAVAAHTCSGFALPYGLRHNVHSNGRKEKGSSSKDVTRNSPEPTAWWLKAPSLCSSSLGTDFHSTQAKGITVMKNV